MGHAVSTTGSWLQLTAMPWLVYTITNSAKMLGLVAFLDQIFILLVSPFAGSIADRINRRTLLLITQTSLFATTFFLAILTIFDFLEVWHIVVLASVNGIINAFDMTFRQSFVLDLVPKENIMNAVGLNSLVFNTARVIGPAFAGIIIAQINIGVCFLLNSLSYLFAIAALLKMKITAQKIKRTSFKLREQLKIGANFIKSDVRVGYLLIQLLFMGILFAALMVLIPIYVKDIYNLGAQGLGWFMTSIGAGALFATFAIASRTSLKGIEKIILYSSIASSIGIFMFGLITNLYAACLFLVIIGFSFVLMMGLTNSLIQVTAPAENRGIIIGFFMSLYGIAPIGSVLAGYGATHLGADPTTMIGGFLAIVLALILRKKLIGGLKKQ
jgi:MFS family permease